MNTANKDLFEHYCDISDLSPIKQTAYLQQLQQTDSKLANQLTSLLQINNELTQVFTESVLNLTDGHNFAQVGDILSHYQLTESLGYGGMGQVFKAQRNDGKIDQTVAIKCLHPLFQEYQSGKLLLQEAQALANLSHPNIAAVYDVAESDNGNLFFVMEYIEGVTLDVYLQKNKLSVAQKLILFNQISDAVLEAHNHQIIHADIKPSNVLISASNQAKLIDFGVMQLTEDLNHKSPKFVTAYLGAMTVNYASPEQLKGAKASIASDVYGLGSLLYFMLSGCTPFEYIDATVTEKIEHINSHAPANCVVSESVMFKSDLMAILNKALSKKPQDRYRTVTDFINDISAFQQQKKLSVDSKNGAYNALKFFYRHRIINTAILVSFIVLALSFLQITAKNKLLIKERNALESANLELKNTFTKNDKNISEAHIKNEAIYLPDPNNLESHQYIEMMILMFDDYYFKDNKPAYSLVIDTLIAWLDVQNNIEPLIIYLAKYRKVLSDSGDNDNYQKDAAILSDILAIETPLKSSVLDLLRFKRFTIKLQQSYFIPLFIRLDDELVKSTLSIQELFSFHSAGGGIYADSDSAKAIYHYQKAYDVAKKNTNEIKLWTFVATSLDFRTALINSKGYDNKQVIDLTNELYTLIKQSNDKKLDSGKLALVLGIDLEHSMEDVAFTLNKYGITFESAMEERVPTNASILHTIGLYYAALGEYEKAAKLNEKSMQLYVSERGGKDPYLLFRVANMYLAAGNIKAGMDLMENQVFPLSLKYYEQDSLGYFQTRTCKKLVLLENTKRLKDLCFGGVANVEESLGDDVYWLKLAVSGVVAWYALQPDHESKESYINLLEHDFEKNNNVNKMNYGTILLRYFISRKNIEKSIYYHNIISLAADVDYGGVDAIIRYYNKIMAAEIDLLQHDKKRAIDKLANIKPKMCGLGDKNPHKVKFLALQQSLNQPACNP